MPPQGNDPGTFESINFTVDAKLLRELGERLVAKPSIALAELVKNAYDADATWVEIDFEPEKDYIVVRDNGHGMTMEGVRDFWMRIGTTHKDAKKTSLLFQRNLTGSKGIGRLSVQFLASKTRMITAPHPRLRGDEPPYWIETHVDWAEAVDAGDLTEAKAKVRKRPGPPPWPYTHGTEITLTSLRKHEWTEKELKELAKEVWWLQPPFPLPEDNPSKFEVRFRGPIDFSREFEEQMRAIERIQIARLIGRVRNGKASVVLEFWQRGQPEPKKYRIEYAIADLPGNDGRYDPTVNLHDADFEIRIYKLEGRQPRGIRVQDLRDYLDRFAGVHVYDGGFRLPFYGDPKNDWLEIEYDHAHRLFTSQLLPQELQEQFAHTERLRYLPTLRRIIGVVRVDTSTEPGLDISITRDRLMETRGYEDLRQVVRYALDWYAYQQARRAFVEKGNVSGYADTTEPLQEMKRTLKEYEKEIPENVHAVLSRRLRTVEEAYRNERKQREAWLKYLGPLATAGIEALAIQHELRKQFQWLERLREQLKTTAGLCPEAAEEIERLDGELGQWLRRAQETNSLFDFLSADFAKGASRRDRKDLRRYPARMVVEQILDQVSFFAQGTTISTKGIPKDLRLPPATFAEWGAIFQNVFVNAFNAMRTSRVRLLDVSARSNRTRSRRVEHAIWVQDTGVGLDLEHADEYFQPFVRGIDMDRRHMQQGFGGMGLGLSIVKLVAEHIGCKVGFTKPDEDFSTAFVLSWEESK